MKLQCTIPHMYGTTVKVNGTVYRIDGTGAAKVEKTEDAMKLLADSATWRPRVERTPVASTVIPKAVQVPLPPTPPVASPVPLAVPMEETKPDEGSQEDWGGENGKDDEKEWPDPTMQMKISELREIADAYQLAYTARTTKTVLVKAIMEAMYGEE